MGCMITNIQDGREYLLRHVLLLADMILST